jgi:hypothetical protein
MGRRSIGNVLAFDDHQLEHIHDFIQWLFPLPEPSRAQPQSPTLTSAEIAAIRQSSAAQENLKRAAQMMTDSYQRHDHWLRRADHNHLRIIRIPVTCPVAGKRNRTVPGDDRGERECSWSSSQSAEQGLLANCRAKRKPP